MSLNKNDGFQVTIPNDFLPILQFLDHSESLNDKVRVSLAISLFIERAISMERAAELSALSIGGFMQVLQDKEIPWGEYTDEHLKQDQVFIEKGQH
ncbi:UPF0175 family protein [Salicibibacter cibi]|uniref:UPF0175 family protein n=1 Tax=Salicibibacter cibi TaxID=2743001 RepID=A0A7T6Z874_9BACI|nr:UPF0175 family protein [Salicibibacter cibi]QQK78748.1 UPF0175 family protein [Salicibibacter cibi]